MRVAVSVVVAGVVAGQRDPCTDVLPAGRLMMRRGALDPGRPTFTGGVPI